MGTQVLGSRTNLRLGGLGRFPLPQVGARRKRGKQFILATSTGQLWFSQDGANWRGPVSTPFGAVSLPCVMASNGTLVVATNTPDSRWTKDLRTWTQPPVAGTAAFYAPAPGALIGCNSALNPVSVLDTQSMGLAVDTGRLIAAVGTIRLWIGVDPLGNSIWIDSGLNIGTWAGGATLSIQGKQTGLIGSFSGMGAAFFNGKMFARSAGATESVYYWGGNFETLKSHSVGATAAYDPCAGNGCVIFPMDLGGIIHFYRSTNGIDFVDVAIPGGIGGHPTILFNGERFVCSETGFGNVYYSDDGLNWTLAFNSGGPTFTFGCVSDSVFTP